MSVQKFSFEAVLSNCKQGLRKGGMAKLIMTDTVGCFVMKKNTAHIKIK